MKQLLFCLVVIIFTLCAAYGEEYSSIDGFQFDTPKREGDLITYTYNISNIDSLDSEISKLGKNLPNMKDNSISSIRGKIICDCKTYKMKAENTFFDSTGKVIASHTDSEYQTASDEMIKELCNMY